MKTEISRFCEASLQSLHALPPALLTAAENLEKGADESLLQKPLAVLNDVRARLRSLTDKLSSQQAYLLIFGPLKSGKSTLMNAISGAYVSEVTSLPGYPCLVYVQHSEDPHFSVTRYNGRESVFADGLVLKDVIADSHVALAQQIRATEEQGSDFDPRTHFTEAIRRVDVKVPVRSLAESSTVLVDTPGLYSRMNFGYDVLTREFRDSAACAVFVVKTDNLFLEQVFAEFNQLLGLFSRIFLVINVDSSKRDLAADGSLQPSAESAHPEQVIEAFKTLSMAGPLRQAYEQKRVRIHAVDLLNAASSFLSHNGSSQHGQNGHGARHEGFNAFQRDLTDYLNSSDYTLEFIRDSLRQGCTLCEEIRATFEGEEIQALRETQNELDEQMRDIDGRIDAIDRLLKVDWEATFEKAQAENTSRGAEFTKLKVAELGREMRQTLDRWYSGGESLKALEQKYWNPLLAETARLLADDTRARLSGLLGTPLGGAEPAALVMNDLHAVAFNLGGVSDTALPKLHEKEATEPYRMTLKTDEVPVRKSFADWMLFRKAATVRRKLFGEDSAQEIPPELKEQRLPETSREVLVRLMEEALKEKFPGLPAKFAERLLAGYVARFRTDVVASLQQQRDVLVQQRAERQSPFDANTQALVSMETLHEQAAKTIGELEQLARQEQALIAPEPAAANSEEPIEQPMPQPLTA